VLTDSGKAVVALGRVADILREPTETEGEHNPTTRLAGRIRAHDLSFFHATSRGLAVPTLDRINFDIAAGETIGIVGAPGSGKTTLIQVLLRIFDGQEGQLYLDDHPLDALSRKYVRGQVSVVLQESFLYAGSIRENLRLGRPNATPAELEACTQIAQIHETIMRLPRGYDSAIGERGVNLSGGQRQRLAIARALLKDPAILVLDDALSAVDTDTEALILDALKTSRSSKTQRTTLIISHRLSSILLADRIFVLDTGRIAQVGTHQTLARTPGLYRSLCEVQGAVQEEIESIVPVAPDEFSAPALSETAQAADDPSADNSDSGDDR
jgi:ATP-binding cassette subfamily B protein